MREDICPYCGREGKRKRRLRFGAFRYWIVYRCANPRCTFRFRSAIDGRMITGKPSWMCPEKELGWSFTMTERSSPWNGWRWRTPQEMTQMQVRGGGG